MYYDFTWLRIYIHICFALPFFYLRDVRRGVPGERLRKYFASKLQDPSQRALPTVLKEDPVSFF